MRTDIKPESTDKCRPQWERTPFSLQVSKIEMPKLSLSPDGSSITRLAATSRRCRSHLMSSPEARSNNRLRMNRSCWSSKRTSQLGQYSLEVKIAYKGCAQASSKLQCARFAFLTSLMKLVSMTMRWNRPFMLPI